MPDESSSNPFGITREEILNLAAQKIADQHADFQYIEGSARAIIEARVNQAMKEKLLPSIDSFLTAQLEALVTKEIVPVDIWGERRGEPTTIREQLTKRAKEFWETKVDKEGRATTGYGGVPRHEQMFSKIVQAEFAEAVKQDVVNIVGAIKDALIDQCNATVRAKIDELIRVKTQK